MRDLMLVGGLCGLVAMFGLACDSEVSSSASSNSGGSGGIGGSVNTGGTGGSGGSTTTTTTTTTTGGGTACDEACNHVEVTCGFAGACDQMVVAQLLDCSNASGLCSAECINNADCGAIASLLGTPDPALAGCLQDCQGQGGAGGGQTCLSCVQGSCNTEAMACFGEQACQDVASCVAQCSGDTMCAEACVPATPTPVTQALLDCAESNCKVPCGLPDPSMGGAGGSGGAGGAGGN